MGIFDALRRIFSSTPEPPSPSPPPPKLLTDSPWRATIESRNTFVKTCVDDIKKLSPKKLPAILLMGPVGAGKSSFINSCLSIGVGRKYGLVPTGCCNGSYTIKYTRYTESELLQKFRFMDCMGIESNYGKGFNPSDFKYLLNGQIKENYKFEPGSPIDTKSTFYEEESKNENKIHCVVLVLNAKTMYDGIEQAQVDKINILLGVIKEKGVPCVIILTRCDELCSEVKADPNNIFRSIKVETAMKKATEKFGISLGSIHPVVNSAIVVELSIEMKIPIMLALRQILEYACDHVNRA